MSAKTECDEKRSLTGVSHLTAWQLICYGALSLPIAMGGFVLVTYIPTYYAVDLGLGLGLVGFIFVLGRLLDVITDPLIGYLSDKTSSRFGPRRPWMIVSVPLYCLAAWALFVPPETVSLTYLIIASAAYFFFYTALDVPYSSVGLEISPHLHERSTLASVKALFQVAGALMAALLPLILLRETEDTLRIITVSIVILSVFCLCTFLVFVPRKNTIRKQNKPNFKQVFLTTWASRPYRFMIAAFFIVQTANALAAGLTVLFVTNIIKTPQLIGLFLGVLLISSALFLPIWILISKQWSKKTAWASAIIICMLVLATAPLLGEGDIIPAMIFFAIIGAAFGCDAIMPTSMLADIVFKDEVDGKGRFAGSYLAIKNSISKLTFIAPMGLAFPILELIGFQSGTENTAHSLSLLVFFYAILPILLRVAALFIVFKMPKTERLFA